MDNYNEAAILASSNADPKLAGTGSTPVETMKTRLPRIFLWVVLIVCGLPFALNLIGFDFASASKPFNVTEAADMSQGQLIDAMFYQLRGAFTHSLLEWSAFAIALTTCVLAFSHYRITGNITTPIIGLALLSSGFLDVFHTLAAARLIESVADNSDLIPFTWAISRTFNALIMIIGIGLLLGNKAERLKANTQLILLVSVLFVGIAYWIIHLSATAPVLPQTLYPESLITRPWDVGPLILFLFAGLFLYPRFYNRHPSLFAHALVISAIPEIVVQLHMAYGSTALFDNHFNIAHFLKIIAYLVPFAGLVLDYINTYQSVQNTNDKLINEVSERKLAQENLAKANLLTTEAMDQLKIASSNMEQSNHQLETSNNELMRSNKDLEQFAYVASHDLREPLRKVTNYTELFANRYADKLDERATKYIAYITDGTARMDNLIRDLLLYSRASRNAGEIKPVDMEVILGNVLCNLEITIKESDAKITHDALPTVRSRGSLIEQVLQNLLSNAIKFCGNNTSPNIHIGCQEKPNEWEFFVRDDGIGIDPQYSDRIFTIFQRLHTREEYAGTGIGLAVCKTIIERQGGQIRVESELGKGTAFFFTIPKTN